MYSYHSGQVWHAFLQCSSRSSPAQPPASNTGQASGAEEGGRQTTLHHGAGRLSASPYKYNHEWWPCGSPPLLGLSCGCNDCVDTASHLLGSTRIFLAIPFAAFLASTFDGPCQVLVVIATAGQPCSEYTSHAPRLVCHHRAGIGWESGECENITPS